MPSSDREEKCKLGKTLEEGMGFFVVLWCLETRCSEKWVYCTKNFSRLLKILHKDTVNSLLLNHMLLEWN